MNSMNTLEKRDQFRQEQNHILNEIHNLVRFEETNKIEKQLDNIEYLIGKNFVGKK